VATDEREEIRRRLPIETLVGEHVALKRSGRNFTGSCPFHKDRTPSFVVSPERGFFHCFSCGASGDIFRFYMLINKVEFPDALRTLAARTGVELDPEAARRKAGEARAYEVLQAAALYFQQALAGNAAAHARAYLAGRGLTDTTIERFGLGYLPDWGDGLRRALPERGVSVEELLEAGVLIASDQGREPFCPFHERLIFPIRDVQGRVCGFGGRILGDGHPKYLNSRQSALFDKSSVLYTIDRAAEAIRASGEAVIVEGYMDALRAHQDGFSNVVASLGTAITERHLKMLVRLKARDAGPLRVVLALDADAAGARAAAEAGVRASVAMRQTTTAQPTLSLGNTTRPPIDLFIASLPEGRDPDEVLAESPDRWRKAIADAAPVMDALFEVVLGALDRRSPTFSQDLLAQLLPLIGLLPGVALQQPYLERLSAITRIDTAGLRGELVRVRGEAQRARRAPVGSRQSELATLQQATESRDATTVIEEELLVFLLRQLPLPAAALERLATLQLSAPAREEILQAVRDTARVQSRAGLDAVLAALGQEAGAVAEALLAAKPTPLVDTAKVAAAIRTYAARLEHVHQRDLLRQRGELLDGLDSEAARALLGSTQDLVASRNDLTKRMLEEQSRYHLG
jgi:DNA primase